MFTFNIKKISMIKMIIYDIIGRNEYIKIKNNTLNPQTIIYLNNKLRRRFSYNSKNIIIHNSFNYTEKRINPGEKIKFTVNTLYGWKITKETVIVLTEQLEFQKITLEEEQLHHRNSFI